MKQGNFNVAFREVKYGDFKGTIDCVFLNPDTFERNNRLTCYSRIGQHSSGDVSYFYHSTKPTLEFKVLLTEIEKIYHDYDVIIHTKLPPYQDILTKLRNAQ